MRGPQRLAVAVCLLVGLGAAGCYSETRHPSARQAYEAAAERGLDENEKGVGTVAGRRIGLGRFRRYWEAHPSLELPAVIDEVVEREVAARQGVEGGLVDWSAVGVERKKAMVRQLLRERVEADVRAEDLQEEAIETEMRRLHRQVARPAGLRVSHLLVAVPADVRKKGQAKGGSDSDLYRQARKWGRKLGEKLPDTAHLQDLYALQTEFGEAVPDPLKLVVNPHLRFVRPGQPKLYNMVPDGWRAVVEPFQKAAEKLAGEGKIGRPSAPVDTRFGTHLIVVEERIPAEVPRADALREVAVAQLLREKRNARLRKLYRRWSGEAVVTTYPERLEEKPGRR